jgi:type IV secretory pathway VirB4 component
MAPADTRQQQARQLEAEQVYRQGVVSVRELLAPASFKVDPNFVQLGGVFARTLFVSAYPRYLTVGWFASVINYSAALDIAIYFYPLAVDVVLKKMRKKVGELEAQLSEDTEHGAPRDPARETAVHDLEQLRDDLTQGTERFFQVGLYLTVYASSADDLNRLTERLEGIIGSRLVYTKRAFFQTAQGFNSTLPLASDELGVTLNLNTSPAAASFPFTSADLTSDRGIMYGINRHNNSLIIFDRFSLQNANMVVFASAGSGKSYAVKLEILRSLMLGTDVIVIDPEMEYQHLCEAVGGTYINVSLASETKINPFDLPAAAPGGDTKASDVILTAVIAIKGLLRLMVGGLTPQEDSLLDRAILETYAKNDITPTSDLTKVKAPLMDDLVQVLGGLTGAESIVQRLGKYTTGTFSGLFNAPTNVQLANQLVVFSVRDLQDELRPLAIYNIILFIWSVVRSQLKQRMLVIDEAWWLMQYEDSARFIYALVKRCRKYYLGITTITQDVQDFLKSPYGPAIINNSALALLMRQHPNAIGLVQQSFLLTEGEKYLLLECNVGEGIFFAGSRHAAVKVMASYSEDQLITTDPRQLLEIEQAKQEFARSKTTPSQ